MLSAENFPGIIPYKELLSSDLMTCGSDSTSAVPILGEDSYREAQKGLVI